MHVDHEYEDSEEYPPTDDVLEYVKGRAYELGVETGLDMAIRYIETGMPLDRGEIFNMAINSQTKLRRV